jgi:sugar phosphate isomerase/epimerase
MRIDQVACQLYTLRDHLNTPAAIAATLKKVRAIGYQAVQISGMGPIPELELLTILAGEGLVCCATHENGDTILNEPQKVVDRLRALRCAITAYPWPGGIKFDTLENVQAFAARLNAAGQVLAAAGQILCYHNHHLEFVRIGNRTALEIIYAETDPRYLQGEPDTYWVQFGGGDPVEWCERLANRLPIIHLKDYQITSENKVNFCEIGAGNLNWKRIIGAADAAGCQWFAVEQDVCPGDPFDSLKQSFEFVRDNLCVR